MIQVKKQIEIPGWIHDRILDILDYSLKTENDIIVMALIHFIGNRNPEMDKDAKSEENKEINNFRNDVISGRYKH